MESATAGDVDEMENTASNIMVGNAPKIGTNTCTILNRRQIFDERKHVIEANDRIIRNRLMDHLEPVDIIRLIPTLATHPKFMVEKNDDDSESFQYENYKKEIAEKHRSYKTPDYDYLLDSSIAVLTESALRKEQFLIKKKESEFDDSMKKSLSMIQDYGLHFQQVYTPNFYHDSFNRLPADSPQVVPWQAQPFGQHIFDKQFEQEEAKIMMMDDKLSFFQDPTFNPYPLTITYSPGDDDKGRELNGEKKSSGKRKLVNDGKKNEKGKEKREKKKPKDKKSKKNKDKLEKSKEKEIEKKEKKDKEKEKKEKEKTVLFKRPTTDCLSIRGIFQMFQ
jgi:hypothetical protein